MAGRMIIGFSGKRGVGKSTAAGYLARKYGFTVVSFSSKLKEMAKSFFPFTASDFLDTNKEKPFRNYDWTPRDFLISLGQLARYYDEDFWVKNSGVTLPQNSVVVDDVRFPNEVQHLRSLGAKIVRVNRYEGLNIYGTPLDDPSEIALDKMQDFDYTIESCRNVTANDLFDSVDSMLKILKTGH